MSADAITVCPACYAREVGKPFDSITAMDLEDGQVTNQLREFHECYIERGAVRFMFSADCRECGYRVGPLHLSAMLPEPPA